MNATNTSLDKYENECEPLLPQFRGMARSFISRMDESTRHLFVATDRHFAEIDARFRRGAAIREEMLAGFARVVKLGASASRLCNGAVHIEKRKKSLDLSSYMVAANSFTGSKVTSELALDLFLNEITLSPYSYTNRCYTVASIGIHALGRRFQRGFRNDDAAIKRDLETLAYEFLTRQRDKEFYVRCPCGSWVGRTVEGEDWSAADIRTFFSNDSRKNIPFADNRTCSIAT